MKESTKASYDRGPSNEARLGEPSAKHRLRLVLALRVKYVDAKPRSGGAGSICRVGLEWRSRPYVTVSCSEGNEHAPHGNEGQMRETFGHLADSEGVDPRPLSGSETSVPFLPPFCSPQSGQMNPPSR